MATEVHGTPPVHFHLTVLEPVPNVEVIQPHVLLQQSLQIRALRFTTPMRLHPVWPTLFLILMSLGLPVRTAILDRQPNSLVGAVLQIQLVAVFSPTILTFRQDSKVCLSNLNARMQTD